MQLEQPDLEHTDAASDGSPIWLHIGAMKTGTTFIQGMLIANKDRLAEAGLLFPGAKWVEQVTGLRQFVSRTEGKAARPRDTAVWESLRAEMLQHQGAGSLYSMEFISFLDAEQVREMAKDLDGRVRAVITLRDTSSTLPAFWQTRCRAGGTVPWPRFVRRIAESLETGEADSKPARSFRRTQDIPRMLDAWCGALGADRVTVVTVPRERTDPLALWRRFSEAVGMDPALGVDRGDKSNPSVGYPSAELTRRVTAHVGPKLSGGRIGGRLNMPPRMIAALAELDERRIPLLPAAAQLAADWNGVVRDAVERSGVRVIGSLEDLPTTPKASSTDEQPTDAELLSAAETAYDSLAEELAERGVTDVPARDSAAWARADDPVETAVLEIAQLVDRRQAVLKS
ncbi:hypothetical protein [Nocardioides sp. YIM 152588]|uniref:hypothetical protein n=1 Tax=Nocardioides sp. YIM 152588 TaxID=3158259 RepID=UPI0032E50D49